MPEKKLKANQKLALERIYRLFELAQQHPSYSKRYLMLAKRIGEKCRISIPKELQHTYCKKCFSTKVTQTKETPFIVITCKDCKHIKRFPLTPTKN